MPQKTFERGSGPQTLEHFEKSSFKCFWVISYISPQLAIILGEILHWVKFLNNFHDTKFNFHQSQSHANTVSWPTTKRLIKPRFFQIWIFYPSFGIKVLCIRTPIVWMNVKNIIWNFDVESVFYFDTSKLEFTRTRDHCNTEIQADSSDESKGLI